VAGGQLRGELRVLPARPLIVQLVASVDDRHRLGGLQRRNELLGGRCGHPGGFPPQRLLGVAGRPEQDHARPGRGRQGGDQELGVLG